MRISDDIPRNKGLGADLTRRIQDIVEPTHVFQVTGSNFPDDFTYEASSELGFVSKSQFYAQLDSIVSPAMAPLQTLHTSADHHVFGILSYLHVVFPGPSHELSSATSLEQIATKFWRTTLPLCSQLPYAVDWQVALDRIVLLGSGAEDVIFGELGSVLNGALVGLVSNWEDGVNGDPRFKVTCADALKEWWHCLLAWLYCGWRWGWMKEWRGGVKRRWVPVRSEDEWEEIWCARRGCDWKTWGRYPSRCLERVLLCQEAHIPCRWQIGHDGFIIQASVFLCIKHSLTYHAITSCTLPSMCCRNTLTRERIGWGHFDWRLTSSTQKNFVLTSYHYIWGEYRFPSQYSFVLQLTSIWKGRISGNNGRLDPHIITNPSFIVCCKMYNTLGYELTLLPKRGRQKIYK